LNTPTRTTPKTARAARVRVALAKILSSYLPALPSELRTTVLAALPVSEAAALKLTPEDSPTTGPADSALAWEWIKVRDTRPYPERPVFWAAVDVFDAALSPAAKLLALALTAVSSGCVEQVRVPIERLGAMTGLHPQEIRRAMAELLAAGRFNLDPRRAQQVGDPGAAGGLLD